MPPRYKKKIDKTYDYDTMPWIEGEKKKTNYDRSRPTEKGRQKLKEMRDKEEVATTRTYRQKRNEEINDLQKKVTDDENKPIFFKDTDERRDNIDRKQLRKRTRDRGNKAESDTKKKRDTYLARARAAEEKKKGETKGPEFRARQKKMFEQPGWSEWSKEKVDKFLEGAD